MNISHLTFHKKILTSHVLGGVILAQSLIIILLLINSYNLRKTLGSENTDNGTSSQINQDVVVCNHLQPEERPSCAKAVGVKIAMLFSTSEEQIRECMKMRPLLVRYCQEGLRNSP